MHRYPLLISSRLESKQVNMVPVKANWLYFLQCFGMKYYNNEDVSTGIDGLTFMKYCLPVLKANQVFDLGGGTVLLSVLTDNKGNTAVTH